MTVAADAEVYRIPLYTQPQAAKIIDVRPETLRNWARGYAYQTLGGVVEAFPMITTTGSGNGQVPSVPFLGLAEAYVLAAVPCGGRADAADPSSDPVARRTHRASGRSRQRAAQDRRRGDPLRLQPAVRRQRRWNQQRVFAPIVNRYLQTISYGHGYVELIRLPQYEHVDVTVDPRINSGRPTIARRGLRVADVVSRLAAGEPDEQVAADYALTPDEVRSLVLERV